jgi:hypothetical protein
MIRPMLMLALLLPTAAATDLVGRTVPPYPDGLANTSGSCIAGAARGVAGICDYAINVLTDADGTPRHLAGSRAAGHDADGHPAWTITDALPFPPLAANELMAIATCEVDGEADETVVAVVRHVDAEWHEAATWARRYDIATEKFVDVPAAGVRCYNEGWGL